jgi:hypothetical protein
MTFDCVRIVLTTPSGGQHRFSGQKLRVKTGRVPLSTKLECSSRGKASIIHVTFRRSDCIFGSRTAIPETEIVVCIASVTVHLWFHGRTLLW